MSTLFAERRAIERHLLNVGNLPVFEGHFHVFVDVDLFGTQRHFLVRLAEGAFDLIGSHSQFNFRRLRLLLLLLLLLPALLIPTALLRALLAALILLA